MNVSATFYMKTTLIKDLGTSTYISLNLHIDLIPVVLRRSIFKKKGCQNWIKEQTKENVDARICSWPLADPQFYDIFLDAGAFCNICECTPNYSDKTDKSKMKCTKCERMSYKSSLEKMTRLVLASSNYESYFTAIYD